MYTIVSEHRLLTRGSIVNPRGAFDLSILRALRDKIDVETLDFALKRTFLKALSDVSV